ncbi:hypothetical protein E2C01_061246 [Portunus trituberculatus]|uniref:Uncharacterized protein n=1 Tax=Portunus trituberculatus TaxID=210409 RepID=A0A5B7H4N7_PORTR|nr:hypothetical protein [Portunus trituberculatus]
MCRCTVYHVYPCDASQAFLPPWGAAQGQRHRLTDTRAAGRGLHHPCRGSPSAATTTPQPLQDAR